MLKLCIRRAILLEKSFENAGCLPHRWLQHDNRSDPET